MNQDSQHQFPGGPQPLCQGHCGHSSLAETWWIMDEFCFARIRVHILGHGKIPTLSFASQGDFWGCLLIGLEIIMTDGCRSCRESAVMCKKTTSGESITGLFLHGAEHSDRWADIHQITTKCNITNSDNWYLLRVYDISGSSLGVFVCINLSYPQNNLGCCRKRKHRKAK